LFDVGQIKLSLSLSCEGNHVPDGRERQPTTGFMASMTCWLTAQDQDQLRNTLASLTELPSELGKLLAPK